MQHLLGIIGGSGLGDTLAQKLTSTQSHNIDTPFGKPSDRILVGTFGQHQIAFLNRHGQGHKIAPSDIPYAANIYALKTLGVRTIIASGAVGSLRQQIKPKHLAIADQFIDKTFRRQSSFFAGIAAVHCEMAQPTCIRMRKKLLDAVKKVNVETHDKATYVCMEGPQFSTRAESLMHQLWGGDLIGMTAMPEAKLAREAQICYSLIALISDYDCWQSHHQTQDKQTLLNEIIGNLNQATQNAITLIETILQSRENLCDDTCPCRKSLDLAVWTAPNQISPNEKQILSPLFE
jgi:5'-methylthioadenosine phosphorylase